jgi:hypothetical protein
MQVEHVDAAQLEHAFRSGHEGPSMICGSLTSAISLRGAKRDERLNIRNRWGLRLDGKPLGVLTTRKFAAIV